MGNPKDVMYMQPHAMGEWKKRQARIAEKPMQGPLTEIQMLRDEVKALKDRQADHEYAQALSEHERNRNRF